MSTPRTIKRLIACFGSIQLVTVLSVLSYREKEEQELNINYENYLVITPLWAPQGQAEEFAAFIEKMAKSICSWEKISYIPLEQMKLIANKLKIFGLSRISCLVHELIGVKNPDEIYLSREWKFENQLLMNVYESAEKICYGDGIGIYFSESAFLPPVSVKSSNSYSNTILTLLKNKIKVLVPQRRFLVQKEFDVGYFALPSAFGEVPPMKIILIDRKFHIQIFKILRQKLESLIDLNYTHDLRTSIQNSPVSILLTSNFSEAAGRMSLEKEICAYREFLETQGIPEKSVLLIKPHPRDSKLKILQLKSALSDLYSNIFLLSEEILFYLPFEVLFMELFLSPELQKLQMPKIFTFSSACLTLEFLFNAQCIVGFGSDIVEKFFYQDHISSRIKHEADLLSTIQNVKHLNASLV
ncbi:alpha-2,8-polysialyltransferase family protein [Chroococcidiopsis sp. CCMEE 29]|uniref:alpha-2,8-polysialyltransferase family protein n=1 Tax=Chroococcidiopsis sp. CCMEE 29 TaxID=155894 RepID=UPI002021D036|nr:alpha-2,8-polysialyltransferase family protein [Chroococcidiopsis sp. CCMEE 29]